MALTEEQMREFGERLVPLYQELEQNVISDVARRVKKTGRYTETAEIMAKSLMELGYSPAKIQSEVMQLLRADNTYKMAVAENTKEYKQYVSSEIARVTAAAREEGNAIVADAGNMAFNNDLSLWEQAGKSLSEPGGFRQLIDAIALQTNGELHNLTKSMGFKGMGFTAVENVYQHQLDLGLLKLTSGAYSWEQVVNDCVRELAQSGLRSIDYKSGRTMQLDTAVRNCIMTASSQLAGKVTMLNMEATGETLVEVSQHWGARSDGTHGHGDHAYWQGKVYAVDKVSHKSECRRLGYAIRNLEEATGYPSDPKGLHGYNCRHTMYPFFEGISEPNQWEPEPEPVTVNGKEYTYYQATQKQRQMERQIRATKREIETQKTLGGDTKDLQSKLRKQMADYKKFSADVDIRPKNERLRVQAGSSNLAKTSAYKKYSTSIRYDNPDGYYASIPKNWKTVSSYNNALKNSNPKFGTEFGYNLNCPNCVCAYEMRKRGYDVVAQPYVSGGSHYLNMHPESAWEGAVIIECSGKNDIIKLLGEIDGDARFEVAFMRNRGGGHVIVAEKESGVVRFLDVQSGQEIDGSCLDKQNITSIECFRIDNLNISQRGVTACQKGDTNGK